MKKKLLLAVLILSGTAVVASWAAHFWTSAMLNGAIFTLTAVAYLREPS